MIRQGRAESAVLSLVAAVVAGVLCLAPLPWGATLPIDRFVVSLLLVGAAALVLATTAWSRVPRGVLAPSGALLVVSAIGFLQALPLPAFVVRLLGGRTERVWSEARLVAGDAEGSAMTLSWAPDQSLDTAAWIGILGLVFLVAAVLGAERRHRRVLGASLVAAALLQVVLPTFSGLGGRGRLFAGLGPSSTPVDQWFRGTYANPNHLSLLLGMVLMAGAAAAWWGARRALKGDSLMRKALAVALPAVLLLGLSAATARIGSRAGMLALAFGFLVHFGLLAAHYGRRKLVRVFATFGTVATVVGSVWYFFFGGRDGLGDLLNTSVYDLTVHARLRAVGESLLLWWEAPLFGVGLGAYRQAFPIRQTNRLSDSWEHVHNDWVELLVTGGPLAAAVFGLGLFLLVRRLWTVFHRGRTSEERAAGLAALGALVVAGVHELFDFGLLVPANALVLVVLCGAAAGAPAGVPRRRRRRRRSSRSSSPAPAADHEGGETGGPASPGSPDAATPRSTVTSGTMRFSPARVRSCRRPGSVPTSTFTSTV